MRLGAPHGEDELRGIQGIVIQARLDALVAGRSSKPKTAIMMSNVGKRKQVSELERERTR